MDKYGRDVIRVLRLDRNRGKGGAVRMVLLDFDNPAYFASLSHTHHARGRRNDSLSCLQGMLSARGRRLLMLDADAATDINDFVLCENRLKEVEKVRRLHDGYCFYI